MKVRFEVERTFKFRDYVEMELESISDVHRDEEVIKIIKNRDISLQKFINEYIEIIEVEKNE